MRVSKNPDERREEIIETAQQLFILKGFAGTKVSDIVKQINVSQGVFYYYFKSKEEIIEAIIDRYIGELVDGVKDIVESNELSGTEKLKKMSGTQLRINSAKNRNIHAIKGVDIHERIFNRLTLDYVPLMSRALGKKDDKKTLFMMEIFMTAGNVLFDPGIFQWSGNEKNERIEFLIRFMEESLNLAEGTLSFYRDLMGYAE